MKKSVIVAGVIFNIMPVLLWIFLGIASGQPWYYYVLCGVLSIADVINTVAMAHENIRYYLHHREGMM